MEIPPEVRYVVRDGKSIAYQRFGSGDRRLVVIWTSVGNLDLVWTDAVISDLLVHMSERYECVMYDQLGFGLSDPVDHVPTIEERAADMGAVMDAVGFANATIDTGYDASLGAVLFAAQQPDRVDGLLLLAPFAQGWLSAPVEELVGWEDAEQVAAYEREWDHAYEHWGRGESVRMTMPALATPRNLRTWGMLERACASPAMVRTQQEISSRADVRDVLRSVQAPALVTRPTGNGLPELAVRYVAELLPNGTYWELPETDSLSEFFATYLRRAEEFAVTTFGATDNARADRALMTVLFTDIVGSTEQAVLLGDARWRELLMAHERILRREVEAVGGRLLKLTGDGSLSTFDGPARAIRCAERISAAAGQLDLRIRAGIHTGECEVIEGDVAGIAVHIAARVSAQAGPGEVLVSRTVRDLVTGSGIALQSRGERDLKGVEGSWELFAVGSETAPLPAPDQTRELRASDRVVLLAARRAPGLLRAASRIGTQRGRRKPEKLASS
jgi:class 3 adenylate cyclase/pimeloyl-ACP methyl ester carboxylesterase